MALKIKHNFKFNDQVKPNLIAYCSCGFRIVSENHNKVYGICFSHLDYEN